MNNRGILVFTSYTFEIYLALFRLDKAKYTTCYNFTSKNPASVTIEGDCNKQRQRRVAHELTR